MPDDDDSKRPQERDFHVDQWEKFPFEKKQDPFENRSEERKETDAKSQYAYEGWEHEAFPNKNVSEEPAKGGSQPHTDEQEPAKKKRAGRSQ
jgi:hypothetical protein